MGRVGYETACGRRWRQYAGRRSDGQSTVRVLREALVPGTGRPYGALRQALLRARQALQRGVSRRELPSKFSAHHEANTQFTTRTGVAKSEAAKKPAAKKPAAKKPAAKKPAAKVAPKSAKSVVASEAEEGGIDWEAVDWDALQKPSQ